jgi:hypothetical protein
MREVPGITGSLWVLHESKNRQGTTRTGGEILPGLPGLPGSAGVHLAPGGDELTVTFPR